MYAIEVVSQNGILGFHFSLSTDNHLLFSPIVHCTFRELIFPLVVILIGHSTCGVEAKVYSYGPLYMEPVCVNSLLLDFAEVYVRITNIFATLVKLWNVVKCNFGNS